MTDPGVRSAVLVESGLRSATILVAESWAVLQSSGETDAVLVSTGANAVEISD